MIALLASAWALTLDDLPRGSDDAVPVYLSEGAEARHIAKYKRECEETLAAAPLPVGMAGEAWVETHPQCGDVVVFRYGDLKFGYTDRRDTLRVTPESLSADPGSVRFDLDTPAIDTVFVEPQRGWIRGRPLGGRVTDPMVVFTPGARVDVLWWSAPRSWSKYDGEHGPTAVVRRSDGVVAVFSSDDLATRDPLLAAGDEQRRRLVDRFEAGLAERRSGLVRLPEHSALQDGGVYWTGFTPEQLSDPVFVEAWLDPTGHVLEQCRGRGEDRVCRRYFMDWSGFGAWWPRRPGATVVVEHTGMRVEDGERLPVLKLWARNPTDGRIGVAAGWDRVRGRE